MNETRIAAVRAPVARPPRPARSSTSSNTRELVAVGAPAPHDDRRTGAEAARPAVVDVGGGGAHRRGEEPHADRRQRVDHVGVGRPVRELVGVGERGGEHAERIGVARLVVTDAGEDLALLVGRRELDQAAVRAFGRHLQHHVELAVPAEGLEPQLPLHQLGDASGHPGDGHERAGRARPQRGGARVAVVLGRGDPARQRTLQLAPVDHERRRQPAPAEEDAAQVLGVQLLVLPDPHQGLAQRGPQVVAQRERVDAAGDRFLAVRHRDDLLPFEREQPEVLGLLAGTPCVLDPPAREEAVDLGEHDVFELAHRRHPTARDPCSGKRCGRSTA